MKPEDIQIGDLLTFEECLNDEAYPVIKVTGILQDSFFARIDDAKADDELDYKGVVGIPLTAKILEKNGFKQHWWWKLGGESLWLSQSGDEWRAYANDDDDKRDNFCWIKYVHQLQHCLNLLGIEKEIVV